MENSVDAYTIDTEVDTIGLDTAEEKMNVLREFLRNCLVWSPDKDMNNKKARLRDVRGRVWRSNIFTWSSKRR